MPNKKIEAKAQEIVDIFFALGAKVSKKEYDTVRQALLSVAQESRNEALKEAEEAVEKGASNGITKGREWIFVEHAKKAIRSLRTKGKR